MKRLFVVFKRAFASKPREFWCHSEKLAFKEAFRCERARKTYMIPWS
jgi:hypothetical protein